MKNFRDYVNIVKEEQVSEGPKQKVADKVMQNIVGQTATQRLAAELPSMARINGQTWEKVGNNYLNRQTNKVISTDEFAQMSKAAGQAPKPGTTATPATATAPAATTAATTATTAATQKLAKKGSALKRFIQRNPKLATALGIVGGVAAYKAGSAVVDKLTGEEEPQQQGTGTATPAPAPAPAAPAQSGKPEEPSESDTLKTQIDALFKELDPVKDLPVPDELKRLRGKYEGNASTTSSTTVQQSGKPADAKPSSSGDPFRDTYATFGQQNRREAEADRKTAK